MSNSSLKSSFLNTTYRIVPWHLDVQVGKYNQPLCDKLEDLECRSFGFITASNPQGKLQDEQKNRKANENLEEDLSLLHPFILEAVSISDDNKFPKEDQFFIPGIKKKFLLKLAEKYNQVAVVYGNCDDPPELVMLDEQE